MNFVLLRFRAFKKMRIMNGPFRVYGYTYRVFRCGIHNGSLNSNPN